MEELITVSVVIPVYNSELTLVDLISQLGNVLPAIAREYEVILVNDGSRDRSWEVISKLMAQYSWISGINFMRNYGQHNALLCGIRQAQYEIIVTMDDDLQNPPEEIVRLLAELSQGWDVVYGTPQHEQHGIWRDLASQVTKLALGSAMGIATARKVSAFRAFRTQLRDAFSQYSGPYVSIDVLLTWATTRFSAVHVRHQPRQAGRSNYTFFKLVTHAVNMLTGFSTMPLRLASFVGFVFTFMGIVVLFYVVGRYLMLGYSVAGFPFLASIIAIFSGAQLFTIGIIGEYLARMYFRSMNRPSYSIRSYGEEINE